MHNLYCSLEVDIVDDDPGVRAALDRLLRSAGYVTQCFASAEAYLRAGRATHGAHCLVVDVGLPGMTGLELQQQFDGNELKPAFVIITGQTELDGRLREKALRAGAIAFLDKPIDGELLLNAVSVALEHGGLRHQHVYTT